MKIWPNSMYILTAILCSLCIASGVAHANVALPALDIQLLGGDTGVSSDGTTLTMDATAFTIVTEGDPFDIPDVPFSLSATYDSVDGINYSFINGSLSAGSLLSADFDNLVLNSLGVGLGTFAADLSYTGGSLVPGLTTGRIVGSFSGATSGDFATPFTASTDLAGKIGPVVVPVPAALWLFGSGLIGLAGFARRRS